MLSRHARAVEPEAVAEDGESEYLRGLCVNLRQRVAKIAVARVHQTPMVSRSLPNAILISAVCTLSIARGASAAQTADSPASDSYEQYVKNSKDFRPVKQDKAWCYAAFPSWTYMPWTYQWSIGYTEASGRWSLEHGYNGAFIDHGDTSVGESKTGRLDWIDRFKLRFYADHVAAKRYLHLWDGNEMQPHAAAVHGAGIRTPPVNAEMFHTLQGIVRGNIEAVRSSPNRAAYALDDEISWGHFVHPCMWCVTDDKAAYANWLKEVYGPAAPKRDRWITYEDIRPHLAEWTVGQFDASPLMDQWTFNDSYWNNFLGDLVEYANSIDRRTPCGFVGGQSPSPFGGYDYAKLMRKVQFIEAYNVGSSQAIIRSFNPHGAIPAVTTHFHRSADDDIWQTWYNLAHGNRGFIGWVEGWFDGERPKPWHDQVAPTYLEAANKIGPLLAQAEWIHDGVAIYYSHASIQLGWILDAAAHGKTWVNRNGDERLGASHMVRHAWENMLRDSGLQYNFLSYANVIQHGVPDEYRVLVLPACLCLSDAEARRIEEFCRRGGTVIADYMPGLWDQHGRGRPDGGHSIACSACGTSPDCDRRTSLAAIVCGARSIKMRTSVGRLTASFSRTKTIACTIRAALTRPCASCRWRRSITSAREGPCL